MARAWAATLLSRCKGQAIFLNLRTEYMAEAPWSNYSRSALRSKSPSRSSSFGPRIGSSGSNRGTPEAEKLKRKSQPPFQDSHSPAVTENFFDFCETGSDFDIWDADNLVAKLKKGTGRRRYTLHCCR